MSTWQNFVASIDVSSPMTTATKHISDLCSIVEGKQWTILEVGNHMGYSAAALALAAPKSTVTAVDLCDTVQQCTRVDYWASVGVTNIQPVASPAINFLAGCVPGGFDFIFHDAVHGPAAFSEYMGFADVASKVLALHDFEQIDTAMQDAVKAKFASFTEDADHMGRVLFVGYKQ